MLSSDFNEEMASLIRSLESKVRQEPHLLSPPDLSQAELPVSRAALDHMERLIVTLVALHIYMRRRSQP